ncbi:hypothetical protein DUGA6_21410 [Duganella sp. HH105]|nr:hypothetical protein DUGA6_21410 [Duganella sp. HH105]
MRWSAMLCAALAAGGAMAQQAPEPVQQVEVSGMVDADEVSYRRLLKGLDAFEKYRALAPQGSLRYKLFPLAPEPKRPLVVQLRSGEGSAPLALDADYGFALPRDEAAAAAKAVVRTNRKSGSLAWRVDVRTPGLAANQRRLGDLRLECQVNREVNLLNGAKPPAYLLVNSIFDVCTQLGGGWLDVAPHAIFGITMVDGERRKQLFSEQLYLNRIPALYRMFYDTYLSDRSYWLQISDASWPDDTLLEFEYMEGEPHSSAATAAVIGTTKADVVRTQGKKGSATRFDNGYEVWTYDDKHAIPELLHWLPVVGDVVSVAEATRSVHELAILFDKDGIVRKYQLREQPSTVAQLAGK